MIEDDFYATIKFKSGEEVYAKVAASEEDTRTMLLVSNPITIVEVKTRAGVAGYKVEPWLKTTREDLFIINLDDVLTISESSDLEMISIYQRYVQDSAKAKSGRPKITREMGYISTVRDAKDICLLYTSPSPRDS